MELMLQSVRILFCLHGFACQSQSALPFVVSGNSLISCLINYSPVPAPYNEM